MFDESTTINGFLSRHGPISMHIEVHPEQRVDPWRVHNILTWAAIGAAVIAWAVAILRWWLV